MEPVANEVGPTEPDVRQAFFLSSENQKRRVFANSEFLATVARLNWKRLSWTKLRRRLRRRLRRKLRSPRWGLRGSSVNCRRVHGRVHVGILGLPFA